MKRFVLAATVVSSLAFGAERGVGQTWYEEYEEAEQALASERWTDALEHLSAALELRPESGLRQRTYGMRFVDYFPFLRMAQAYLRLDRLDAALGALETEERQGAIDRSAQARATAVELRRELAERRAELERARAERLRRIVDSNLEEAARLEESGDLREALLALDRVLALEAENGAARAGRRRLLAALRERRSRELEVSAPAARAAEPDRSPVPSAGRPAPQPAAPAREPASSAEQPAPPELPPSARGEATADLESRRRIERLLALADQRIEARDCEGALRAANDVLSEDGANDRALRQVSRCYAELNATLLAAGLAPPTLVLDGWPAFDGAAREPRRVDSSTLALTGRAFHNAAVTIRVLGDGVELGPVTLETHLLPDLTVTEFRWSGRLPGGATTLEVVAAGPGGNLARGLYPVEVVVPFVRSWQMAGAVAMTLPLGLGAALFVRSRRRRRLLRERFNPYVAGAPVVEQERFFGRRQLLDYVLRRIGNNSVMLYGERRIGKTSFQHRLKRELAALDDPDYEFHPVFVDLQGIPEERFFATLASEIFHELGPRIEGVSALDRDPGRSPGSAADSGASDYGYRELVRDLHRVLDVLRRAAEASGKKVKLVLLIDEVDELNHYDPRTNQRLRSLFMRAFAENLVTVVSGVGIQKQWDREGSPWYNFFQEVEVRALDEAEARALIEAPVRGVFAFDDGVPAEIIQRTGGKPYLIQRLCVALVERLHEERRRRITRSDLEVAARLEGL